MKRPKIKLIKDPEVTDHTYYEDCMYLSNSMLKSFIDKCPKHYMYRLENPITPTQAMKFGTAFHMLALEGLDKFTSNYVKEPDVDKRTTLGKATLASFNQKLKGREPITTKNYEIMMGMYEELVHHKHIDLLRGCDEVEKIYTWKNEDVDMLCKGKPDAVNNSKKYIVDLKTTRNAHPKMYLDTILNSCYHMQAAYYLDALGYDDYYIIAIEKDKPHCICTFKLSKEIINDGRKLYMNALVLYKNLIASESDGRFPDEVEMLDYNLGEICEI
tara:strand:- start:405 stop:1220 length:816 start_codon:yes stop_codon:yes gene_type:complete